LLSLCALFAACARAGFPIPGDGPLQADRRPVDARDAASAEPTPRPDVRSDLRPATDVALKPDTKPTNPCSDTSVLGTQDPAKGVAACERASAVTQCAAPSLCNAAGGWSLCTSSQFKARYPANGPPLPTGLTLAWLQGCIRDGAAPFAPTDTLCSSCAQSLIAAADVIWLCQSGPYANTTAARLGVVSAVICYTIGTADAANSGFWYYRPVDESQSPYRVLCCR
jgi:hypothetical protein